MRVVYIAQKIVHIYLIYKQKLVKITIIRDILSMVCRPYSGKILVDLVARTNLVAGVNRNKNRTAERMHGFL